MFLSHGYTGFARYHSSIYRYMASYGISVVAPNHNDGSCGTYCTDKDGNQVQFDIQIDPKDLHGRKPQLEKRCDEMKSLIDEISQIQKEIPGSEKADLSLKHLIAGHSYGGATAIKVGQEDERIAGCFPIDPWMSVLNADVEKSFGLNREGVKSLVMRTEHGKQEMEKIVGEGSEGDIMENML